MSDMEEKAAEISHEMGRKTYCIEAEMKKVKVEAYYCFSKEREKVKHECHLRKMQTSAADRSKGASRYLKMYPCLD